MSEAECRQLKGRIARDGQALREAFESLSRAAVAEIDPLDRVRGQPVPWLAGALLLGIFLGTRR